MKDKKTLDIEYLLEGLAKMRLETEGVLDRLEDKKASKGRIDRYEYKLQLIDDAIEELSQ